MNWKFWQRSLTFTRERDNTKLTVNYNAITRRTHSVVLWRDGIPIAESRDRAVYDGWIEDGQ